MKKISIILSLMITSLFINAQCDYWIKGYGGQFNDLVKEFVIDDDGNIIAVGTFKGTFNAGDKSVTAVLDEDIFIMKMDIDGNVIWLSSIGGNYKDDVSDIDIDMDGNVYVLGTYLNSITIGSEQLTSQGGKDVFYTKLSKDGSILWGKNIGSSDDDESNNLENVGDKIVLDIIKQFTNDTVFYNETSLNTKSSLVAITDLNGNLTNSLTDNLPIIIEDIINIDSSAFFIAGVSSYYYGVDIDGSHYENDNSDAYIIKYNTSFDVLWHTAISGNENEENIFLTHDGSNLYIGLESDGTLSIGDTIVGSMGQEDIVLIKYDINGNFIWVNRGGTETYDRIDDIDCDKDGNIYLLIDKPNWSDKMIFGDYIFEDEGYSAFIKYNSNGKVIQGKGIKNYFKISRNFEIHNNTKVFSFNYDNNFKFGAKEIKTNGSIDFCFGSFTHIDDVTELSYATPEICYVTSENDKNKIVWNLDDKTNLMGQTIYQLNVMGEFDSIDYVSKDVNYYIDQSSDSRKRTYFYTVGALFSDKCNDDTITKMSYSEQNVHLLLYPNPSGAWSLLWNEYYGNILYYRILRGSSLDNMQAIDSMSTDWSEGHLTYTDIDAPEGDLYYEIELVLDGDCGINTKSLNKVKSNYVTTKGTSTNIDEYYQELVKLYPNPAKDYIKLSYPDNSNYKLDIYNSQNKLLISKDNLNSNSETIDISALPNGLYILKLTSDDSSAVKIFVKSN